jgi:hypothetical protein
LYFASNLVTSMLKVLVRSEELVIFLPASASPLVVKAEK